MLDPKKFIGEYLSSLSTLINTVNIKNIEQFIDALVAIRDRGSEIFVMGNGGSAATANHFVNDLSYIASPKDHIPFKVHSLVGNESLLTCLANDIGYENVFVWQLKNLMHIGDVVIGISASGNSPNVIKGLRYANDHDGISVSMTGFDGGVAKEISFLPIHVSTKKNEYGKVEDIHMIICHIVANYLAKVKV